MILVKQKLIKHVGYISSPPVVIWIVQFLVFCVVISYIIVCLLTLFSDIGLSVLFRFAINDYPNNTTHAVSGAGTAYNSGAPEFTVSCL